MKASHRYDLVEYTPQAYIAGDLDMFFANFSPTQINQRPVLVSIDGGSYLFVNLLYFINM